RHGGTTFTRLHTGPEYPKYLPPADDVLPTEEQLLPAAISPTAESPGYITESEPKMEPEEEDGDDEKSEEDSIDYPTSGGVNDADDDGDDLSEDDANDEEEEEEESSDSEEEEEEHLALAVERLLAIPTPPLSLVLPTSYQLPPFLMPLPIFTPLHNSSFPLPSSLPSTSSSESIPEADILLQKRARFTTPTGGDKVGESSVVAAARQIRPALTIADRRGLLTPVIIVLRSWTTASHERFIPKLVRIPFGNEILTIHGEGSNERNDSRLNIIFCSKVQEYMSKGCHVFLANITFTKNEDKSKGKRLEDVPVAREFLEVFLEDLPVLAGYYRRFIEGFSKIAKPMTKLTQKKVKFEWGDKQEAAFQLLKQKLCSAPILALPEGSEDFIVYCDASIKGLGVVLMQR
nr:putative reverse transcriptase domain-containing protein [Tanacetum cinerariifolium]